MSQYIFEKPELFRDSPESEFDNSQKFNQMENVGAKWLWL